MAMFRRPLFDTEWTDEPITIYDFINNFTLPQVVKIHESENKRLQIPGNFKLEQPILLFKVYQCRKIHGRALSVNDRGEIMPSGPTLIIPDTYPGWMALVMKNGKTAGHFSSIGEVSRASWSMFLVQEQVIGLKSTPDGLQRAIICGGVVLKTIGEFEDQNRKKLASEYKGYIHPDLMMYLKCLTQQGEVVFLPFSARGRFYCISTPEAHTINHVYLLSNLLRITNLPAFARIIAGPRPNIALPFTNILQLDEARRETIILGCTMVDNEPILLEINANSEFSFLKAKDEIHVQLSDTFQRMCKLCVTEGDRWRQQIRVAHHVVPKQAPARLIPWVSPMLSRRSSFGENRLHTQRELKQILPTCEFVDILKYTYRDYLFPKKFWMFRRSRRFDRSKRNETTRRSNFDVIRGYYTKNKSKKSMILNFPYRNSFRLFREPKLLDTRLSNSDDGYATSFIDDESIYNSVY